MPSSSFELCLREELMKKCPKCGQVYLDESLNFCMTDGESLYSDIVSDPTVVMGSQPRRKIQNERSQGPAPWNHSVSSERKGVNPIFAYFFVGLLALLIGGGIVAAVIINGRDEKEKPSSSVNPVQASNSSIGSVNSTTPQTPSIVYEPAATPAVIKIPVPASSSKTLGLKAYTGQIGGSSATFNLVWNRDKTISGNIYYASEPNLVYVVTGTNYVEGTSELRVSQGSNYIGQMTLRKSIEGNLLCWGGRYSFQNHEVRFCRRR